MDVEKEKIEKEDEKKENENKKTPKSKHKGNITDKKSEKKEEKTEEKPKKGKKREPKKKEFSVPVKRDRKVNEEEFKNAENLLNKKTSRKKKGEKQ